MALIFTLSHDPDSGARSGRLVGLLSQAWLVLTGTPPGAASLETLHVGLRKLAHLAEYAVLYLLVRRAGPGPRKAFALALLYAVLDEWHQTFLASRAGQVRDVLVDAVGIAAAAGWSRGGSRSGIFREPGPSRAGEAPRA